MQILIEFENRPIFFKNPQDIISCFNPQDMPAAFRKIEEALKNGYFIAGFLSYEAGYAFEQKLCPQKVFDFPLLYFGAYKAPEFDYAYPQTFSLEPPVTGLDCSVSKEEYDANIRYIRQCIRLGDVYQITYCIKMLFSFKGQPFALYRTLFNQQPVPYPAYLETEDYAILSLSPEMFMKKQGRLITTKPMKGTWSRGNNLILDFYARNRFQYDKKNRAENVMIADLLRNDLGRVGRNIQAPKLFEVTPYKTLFQMTSTVTGEVSEDVGIFELFQAVFPSGSVTGAPKIRAMEIIRDIEKQERRIYTGAIGYITPNKDLFFNIPIRTALLEKGRGEMGIGGGIVWDSTPDGEWAEGLLKAQFLTDLANKGSEEN